MIIAFRATPEDIAGGNGNTETTIVFGQVRNAFLNFTLTEALVRKVIAGLGVGISLGNLGSGRV